MICWKIFTMRNSIDEKGRLHPIMTMVTEENTQDTNSRQEAFDDFDAFCGLAKDRLTEPGMGITLTLTEYEHYDDEDGRMLAIVHIVRGYREAGKNRETGEITYERDEDDKPGQPVFTRYEKYWTVE